MWCVRQLDFYDAFEVYVWIDTEIISCKSYYNALQYKLIDKHKIKSADYEFYEIKHNNDL